MSRLIWTASNSLLCYDLQAMPLSSAAEAAKLTAQVVAALRRLAAQKRFSLKEIEVGIGETQGYWARVAKGKRPPRLDRLFAALLALGVHPRDFFAAVWTEAAENQADPARPVSRAELDDAVDDLVKRFQRDQATDAERRKLQ